MRLMSADVAVVSVAQAEPGTKAYAVTISAGAHHFFGKSWVVPAQQLAAETERGRQLKKASVSKPANTALTNPDTTTGLVVCADVLAEAQRVQDGREAATQQQIARAAAAAAKRDEKAVAAAAFLPITCPQSIH